MGKSHFTEKRTAFSLRLDEGTAEGRSGDGITRWAVEASLCPLVDGPRTAEVSNTTAGPIVVRYWRPHGTRRERIRCCHERIGPTRDRTGREAVSRAAFA